MCTNITLKSKNKIVTGRTNEFAILLDANFVVYLRGEELNGFASDKTKGVKWKNKYGFIGVEAPDYAYDNVAIDGINEEGLSIQGLYLPKYTEYENSTNADNEVTGLTFSNYVLGNFKDVDEVREGLKAIKVVKESCKFNGDVEPLHYQINDRNGKAIVVEFVNREIKVYENNFGVMTNSPEFPIQLMNLGNYTHLSKYNYEDIEFGDNKIAHLGQGSGALGLPGDMTPMSRFVRAAFLVENAHYDDETIVDEAFHILNSFDIVAGSTCQRMSVDTIKKMNKFVLPVSEDTVTEVTQFTLVKDLTNKIMYVKDLNNQNIRCIEMNKLNFTETGRKLRMPLIKERNYEDVTADFKKYNQS